MPNKRRNKNKNYQNFNHHNGGGGQGGGGVNKQSHYHNRNGGGGAANNHGQYNRFNRKIYLKPSILNSLDNDTPMNGNGALEDRLSQNTYQNGGGDHQNHNRYKYDKGKKAKKLMDNFKEMGVDKTGKTKLSIGDNDNEIKKTLQASKDHCQLSSMPETVFPIIVNYVQNYFSCYDSNRQGLLGAYNPKATFSMTLNMNNPAAYRPFKFDESFTKENRNLKRLVGNEEHHRERRYRLLRQGHIDTVSAICKLPPTEHDPKSFKLDSCFFMPNLISFTLSGVFREGKPTDKVRPLRAFNRVFVCIPDANTQMSIVNEQYTISNITHDQYKLYFAETPQQPTTATTTIPQQQIEAPIQVAPTLPVQQPIVNAPIGGINPVLLTMGLNEQQALMATQFSAQTNLNAEWSKYCLEHAGWNYEQAGQTFLSVKDSIPPEAYSK